MPFDEFAGESAVGGGADAARIVFENGFAEARRFAQADGARDDGVVNALAEMLPHFADHLLAEIRPAVEHRHHDAADLDASIRAGVADLLDHAHDFHQPFERKKFALDRRQQFVRGGQSIRHQNPNEAGNRQERSKVSSERKVDSVSPAG